MRKTYLRGFPIQSGAFGFAQDYERGNLIVIARLPRRPGLTGAPRNDEIYQEYLLRPWLLLIKVLRFLFIHVIPDPPAGGERENLVTRLPRRPGLTGAPRNDDDEIYQEYLLRPGPPAGGPGLY